MSEEEDKTRTATDILLEMEAKLETMFGYIKNQDNLLKILSNKLSDLGKSNSTGTPVVQKDQPVVSPPVKQMPGIKEGVVLFPQKVKTEEPVVKPITNHLSVVPVSQLITKNGEPLVMAEVSVYKDGDDSVLLKQLKTSASGKWTTTLSPGDYRLMISKKGVGKKSPIYVEKEITVEDGNETVILESIDL